MNLFVNDIPVQILYLDEEPPSGHVNFEIDASTEEITKAKLIHHVWIRQVSVQDMDLILDLINSKVPTNLFSLYVSAKDYEALKLFFKTKFILVRIQIS